MNRRNSWAGPALVVLLVALPILETYLLIRVGRLIGGLETVGVLIVEALLGAWLMRREGSRAWRALKDTMSSGRMPAAELTDAALVLAGGCLLMVPGFLTDVVGLVFLVPFTRPLARKLVAAFAARQVARSGLHPDLLVTRHIPGSTIPGEVVEEPGNGASPAPHARTPRDEGEPPAISGTVL